MMPEVDETLLCPHCMKRPSEGAGRIRYIRGFLLLHTRGWRTHEGCTPCYRGQVGDELARNVLLGWWCLPWGALTPFVVAQNVRAWNQGPTAEGRAALEAERSGYVSAPRQRARTLGAMSIEAVGEGMTVRVTPDRQPVPLLLVAALTLAPIGMGVIFALDAARSAPEHGALRGIAALILGIFGAGAALAWFARATTGWTVHLGAQVVTVAQGRRWLDGIERSTARVAVQEIVATGREVLFRGPGWRLSMPGRSEASVKTLATELNLLLAAIEPATTSSKAP